METASFKLEISEGYKFRKLVEYIKNSTVNGNFIFTADTIRYTQENDEGTILNDVVLNKCDLPSYSVSPEDASIVCGINTMTLKIVSRVNKPDGIRIEKEADENKLMIQLLNNARGPTNFHSYTLNNYPLVEFNVEEYENDENHPNFIMPIVEFLRVCGDIGAIDCTSMSIQTYPAGLNVLVDNKLDGITSSFPMGDPNDEEDNIINEIPIEKSTIKTLTKINGLSEKGNIKFYFQKGLPIKLLCLISCFGVLRIYLRAPKEDSRKRKKKTA